MTPRKSNSASARQIPSWSHPLGTDYEGRDILTRIIYGGRVSLAVSVLSVLLGTTVGALWGVASAYIGGRFDMHSQRLLEIFMSFPPLVLAMVLVIGMGAGLWAVVIAIGITRLPFGVRVVRSVALSVKELAYVEAARAIGASNLRIMVRYIAPQCLASYLVLATAQLGVAIVIEASLGFLGVGIPPPTPTWGNMMGGAVANVLIPHWPLVVFPGAHHHPRGAGVQLFWRCHQGRFRPEAAGRKQPDYENLAASLVGCHANFDGLFFPSPSGRGFYHRARGFFPRWLVIFPGPHPHPGGAGVQLFRGRHPGRL